MIMRAKQLMITQLQLDKTTIKKETDKEKKKQL